MNAATLATVVLAGCGRIAFEPRSEATDAASEPDAAPCVGDFFVDVEADDPTLTCTGAGCSLRAALALANARGTAAICVGAGLSIAAATALEVTGDVTIVGATTAICGTGADRVFRVRPGGALRLRDLTVCHGRLTEASGAGVLVESGGTLDANRVWFTDNVVVGDMVNQDGGAVRADGDVTLDVRQSRFTDNHVTGPTTNPRGGALAIRADGASAVSVSVVDTAFEDNSATNVGGAIFLALDGAAAKFERLLFARNNASTGSAVDINCAASGTIVFESSTFADNGASASVIYVCGAATVRLAFSSFRGNLADLVGLNSLTSRAEWHANAVDAGAFALCNGMGKGSSLDHNIASVASVGCPLDGAADQIADPQLAALAGNGGLTATLALRVGSPAIDAAGPTCPALDQRRQPRPLGAACDVGAVEVK